MEVAGGRMMEAEYAWQKMWDESVLRRLCAEMGASSLSYPLVRARPLRREQLAEKLPGKLSKHCWDLPEYF